MPDQSTVAEPVDALAQFALPEFRRNPYPFLHWLREHEPVHRSSAGFYLLSRHADALWILQNTGSVFVAPDRERLETQLPLALRHRSVRMQLNTLLLENPPEHGRLRRLVSRDLTPRRRMAGLRKLIDRSCDRLLNAVAEPLGDGEVVDLHSEVSKPLTVHVFSEMFGIPEADRGWLAEAVIDVVVALEAVSEDLLTVADVQSARVEEYLLELIAERRRAPQEDLISALVGTHVEDPEQLTDDELIAMLWVLWLAGFETTAMGIDNGVRALLDHPSQCGSLHGDHAQAHAFVDEVLRYDGVLLFGVLPRIATRDMEFSGATVSAGSDVRIVFAGANRDPAVFAEPDRFDPSRDTSAGLAFGHGMRYCLGPALSRLEMAVCLSGIHTRFPTLVAAGEPTWNDIVLQRAMKRFPVALDTSTRTRC